MRQPEKYTKNDWAPLTRPDLMASVVHRLIAFWHTSPDAEADGIRKRQTHTINPTTKIFIFITSISGFKSKNYAKALKGNTKIDPPRNDKKKARLCNGPRVFPQLRFTPRKPP
jgi:hypothetical protein